MARLSKVGTDPFGKVGAVLLLGLACAWNCAAQQIELFKNGKSDYVIVVPRGASAQCEKASTELRDYLQQITGTELPLTNDNKAVHRIVLEEGISTDASFDIHKLNDDGFRMLTANGNLYFTARTGQGLLNAVYTFLDEWLGCRYYSAEGGVVVPQKKDITLRTMGDVQNSVITFRRIRYQDSEDPKYAAWHKLTSSGGQRTPNGWGLWVHTMYRFVPPEQYFEPHPEYFAMRNGTRVKDQLCLSNPDVLKLTVERLRQMMASNTTAKYWSVSQMDNYQFCQCDQCKAVDTGEGSASGSIIKFANAVAAQFPDKVISTLAYQYSRKAPKHLKPATNVNIMLCTIECDRSKPLREDNSPDGFYSDIKAWAAVSSNILVWDYVVDFSHLLAPFPNLHVLGPNIELFAENHATMIYEQGHPGVGCEFSELRCYLLSKLLWNPKADVDALMNDFLKGYYGAAMPFLKQYIDLETRRLKDSGKALTLYEPPAVHAKGYLAPARLREYAPLFEQAAAAVKNDPVLAHRVDMARQSIRYAWLEISKYAVFTDDWIFKKGDDGKYTVKPEAVETLEKFHDLAKQYGPRMINEKALSPDDYYSRMTNYFANGVVNHLAVGKQITFEKPSSQKYPANGPGSLVDGVRGTEDYQVLWQGWLGDDAVATIDLGTVQPVSRVEVNCLDDSLSWIMAASGVDVEISADGKNYSPAATYTNPDAGKQIARQVMRFNLPLKDQTRARFVKVRVKNVGRLPAWRGVDDKAWLFVDEIVVR